MRAGVLGALALLALGVALVAVPEPVPLAVEQEPPPPSDVVGPPPPATVQAEGLVQADPMAAGWAFVFALAVGVGAFLLFMTKRTSG